MSPPVKVDMHVHLFPSVEIGLRDKQYVIWEYGAHPGVRFSDYPGTVPDILEAMPASGVSKAVLLMYFTSRAMREAAPGAVDAAALDAKMLAMLEEGNRWGCEVSRKHPEIKTFVTVDPGLQSPEEAAAHIRDMAENHGAWGLKLHAPLQGFSMADRRLWPTFAACQELGLAVLGHAGPDREGKGYSEPREFEPMLDAFPDLPVVLAHMGGAAWRQTAEVAARHPNAFFDCSEIIEWTGSPNGPSDAELGALIREVGAERVMMGSDFPWYDLDHTVERVMELPVLSAGEKEAILGANAIRILKL